MSTMKSKKTSRADSFHLIECENCSRPQVDTSVGHKELACCRPTLTYGHELKDVLPDAISDVTIIIPPAIAPVSTSTASVQIFGLSPDADVRLVLHQESSVLLERSLDSTEIVSGEIHVNLPPLSEGIVTFLLISEKQGTETTLHSVPCCIVPQIVVQDILTMLQNMCSIADEDLELPDTVVSENERFCWIWREHFSVFLKDVEILFQWLESPCEQGCASIQLITNMLQKICEYDAWEFAAYMISKACDKGIKIYPETCQRSQTLTGKMLKDIILGTK